MKKGMIVSVGLLLLLSSCGSYTATGAYTGSSIGQVLGSAIGGIAGGPRGSDIGTIVGMAGGAAVGTAIGSAADKSRQRKYEEAQNQRVQQRQQQSDTGYYGDDSGFDPSNRGDDRISFDSHLAGADAASSVVIRNARLIDGNRDGVLTRGEECSVVFEIMNNSRHTVYDVQPIVTDLSNNKHIHVSQNLHVESIAPGKGIRYSATILADSRLKDGEAVIRVSVAQGQQELMSQAKTFRIPTRKK